jgi:hypothetical protein
LIERTQHVVYWTEEYAIPQSSTFEDLDLALRLMQYLREQAKSGMAISFICCASEIAGNVTELGVEAPSADYNWKKRRK